MGLKPFLKAFWFIMRSEGVYSVYSIYLFDSLTKKNIIYIYLILTTNKIK